MGPLRTPPPLWQKHNYFPTPYINDSAAQLQMASLHQWEVPTNQQCLFVTGCLLKAQEWVDQRGNDLRVTDRRAWSQELFNHQLFYLCLSPWLLVWRQSSGWNSSRPSDVLFTDEEISLSFSVSLSLSIFPQGCIIHNSFSVLNHLEHHTHDLLWSHSLMDTGGNLALNQPPGCRFWNNRIVFCNLSRIVGG